MVFGDNAWQQSAYPLTLCRFWRFCEAAMVEAGVTVAGAGSEIARNNSRN